MIFLHGLGASGQHALEGLGLRELGERERLFVSAPDGTLDSAGRRFWNAGPACCNFDGAPVDDVARLTTLIDTWRARSSVDPNRIYVVGFSNGGFMAQRLACDNGDGIAAIVSIAGAGVSDPTSCRKNPRLSVLQIHGVADPIVRYEGGSVFDTKILAPHPSARDVFRKWGKRLGCGGEPQALPAIDLEPRIPGHETERLAFRECSGGRAELWTVQNGAHLIATAPAAVNAIWNWLSQRARPAPSD